MIYVLAAHLEDCRQWCTANGVARVDVIYVGQTWALPRRFIDETDRIVRTEGAYLHPSHLELERMLDRTLAANALTETKDGRLVRQVA
jgi:hypothetical protein